MHPYLFHIGPLTILSYGTMLLVGTLAASASSTLLARSQGLPLRRPSFIVLSLVAAALLGGNVQLVLARLFGSSGDLQELLTALFGAPNVVFAGISASITCLVFTWVKGIPFLVLTDLLVASIPLFAFFRKVGCFLNGCCYGSPCSSWIAVRYPAMSPAWFREAMDASALAERMPVSSPLHPVQLYVAVASLVLYAVLLWVHRRSLTPGWTTTMFGLLFPATCLLDFAFRGDASVPLSLVFLCLAVLAVGLGMLIHLLDRRFVRKRFLVLHHPTRRPVILKHGWSWPAFLFPPCWALAVRMWGAAFILLLIGVALAFVRTAMGPFFLLAALPLNILCGAQANALRITQLVKRGYQPGPSMEPSTYDSVLKTLINAAETNPTEPRGAEPEN